MNRIERALRGPFALDGTAAARGALLSSRYLASEA